MPEITLVEQTDLEIYRELRGYGCFCNRPKQARKTFCYRCYMLLPRTMQVRLYDNTRDGYTKAVREAKAFLVERLKGIRGR